MKICYSGFGKGGGGKIRISNTAKECRVEKSFLSHKIRRKKVVFIQRFTCTEYYTSRSAPEEIFLKQDTGNLQVFLRPGFFLCVNTVRLKVPPKRLATLTYS
jgi:hypothetical protein